MPKYIFFTGGVVSGLGKGITAASLGALIRARGYSVDVVRFNPYFNVDSSNLNPQLYGESYITQDGRGCDLVVGHYERIMGVNLLSDNDITSGEVYSMVISNERKNAYNGSTVQVVPHITDEIKKCVQKVGQKGDDFVIVEVGGTVGDIEAQPYLEAIRQLRSDLGKNNVAYIHVSLVNYIDVSGEQKTKPTQHSVKELQNLGIQPDVIVCRSDLPLEAGSRNKLSLFCNVDKDCIIQNVVTENIYEIPLKLEKEGFCRVVLRHLKMQDKEPDLSKWNSLCQRIEKAKTLTKSCKLGLVGKFASKPNAYNSLRQALLISGAFEGIKTELVQVCNFDKTPDLAPENPDLTLDAALCAPDLDPDLLKNMDGIIIADQPNFKGIKSVLDYAKNNNLPLLMIGDGCLCAVKSAKTGAIKAGLYKTSFVKNTMLFDIYKGEAAERHSRNFSIFSDDLCDQFVASGIGEDKGVDSFELKNHRFFAGVTFRPEFSVKADSPNRLISAFLRVAAKK